MSAPSQSTEVFQTLADVPSATPVYLSARLKSPYINTTRAANINVLVKWSPIASSKWNGIPLGYVLLVAECDQPALNLTTTSSSLSQRIEIKYSKYRASSHLVRGLSAHKCYRLNIAAWNNVGLGGVRAQDLVINRTSQSKPSNYTYSVNLYTVNSTALRVTWSRLDQAYANGLLTGYLIRYQPVVENPTLKQVTLDPIINYYDYDETSSNSGGDIAAEINPDNDLVFMGNYKPRETFYRVPNLLNQNDLYYYDMILSGLMSHCTYKVEISACTRAGCGQASLPVTIRTLDSLPSRPLDLHFPYVNSTSVALVWSPPRYPNGQLAAYRVRYCLKRALTHSKPGWQNLYLTLNHTNLNQQKLRAEISGLLKVCFLVSLFK